jgi:aryl-alcohol dehydrogenase-like predicted oxidoreductase
MHRPAQLLSTKGPAIYTALQVLKDKQFVQKIGISIYQPLELAQVWSIGKFDLVQAPLSVLDRRLLTSGWLDRLNELGVEVHARSVFLQGLLLMKDNERPSKFERWSGLWSNYSKWVESTGLTRFGRGEGHREKYELSK